MRFRLLRRRLTISAPSMAIRSNMPWPLRWLAVAVMLGICAAVGLWAFEFGKNIAGLDSNAKEELAKLKTENVQLREERDKAQSISNTAESLLTTEKAAQEKLVSQVKQFELENRALKDDLGFFEKLMPANGSTDGISIRGFQAEVISGAQLKWQVLVIQPTKNVLQFNGKLELAVSGTLAGKPWTMLVPAQPMQVQQYRRMEGVLELPSQAVVKAVTAKVLDGNTARAEIGRAHV